MQSKTRFDPGFTLVEIMIAMGIASIALLGLMKLASQSTSTARSQVLDNDFNIVTSGVETVLYNDCLKVLPGASFTPGATPVATFSSFSVGGQIIAAVGSPIYGTRITALQINQVIDADIQVIGNLHEDLVNFNIQAQKFIPGNQTLPGAPFFSKDFKMMIWYNDSTGTIIDCQRPGAVTINLFAPQLSCYQAGIPLELSWNTSGADGISMSAGTPLTPVPNPLPNPSVQPIYFGVQTVTPVAGANTFTATVYGNSGQNIPANVTVTASPSCPADCTSLGVPTFSITPNTNVAVGSSLTATWSASGATSVSIMPSPGSVAVSGTVGITAPPDATTYTLTASNSCGTSAPISVTVTSQGNCTCGNSSSCTGSQTTYTDSCGQQNCNCPSQGTCPPPVPACAHGNPCCSNTTSTWSCPGVGAQCN